MKTEEERKKYNRERIRMWREKKGKDYFQNKKIEKIKYIKNENYLSDSEKRLRIKKLVIQHYTKGEMCCSCCGESHIEFLVFDHIINNGSEHRKKIFKNGRGNIITWLISNKFPEGFQVLCWNCNSAKHYYKGCPHKKE